jgi:mono/diheme cytochrome c family protein
MGYTMRINKASVHVAACALLAASFTHAPLARAETPGKQLARGKYLVEAGGCHDCHTPKKMTAAGPVPDLSLALSGQRASLPVAPVPAGVLGPAPTQWIAMTNADQTAWAGPWGISFSANLTPDKVTGLGNWTVEQFIATVRTGKHLGLGRPLLPPMPVPGLAVLTDSDLKAMFAYLRSVPPVANPVPAPIPPK